MRLAAAVAALALLTARAAPPPRTADAKAPPASERTTRNLLQSLREPAGDAEAACGDPSWFYTTEACEADQGGDDPWGSRRRKGPKYVPPPVSCQDANSFAWCDPAESFEARAKKLVAQMNWTELAAQVSCDIFGGVPAIERLRVNAYNYIRENNHGLLWNDICPVPTMFPQVISMAATFNRSLWRAAGKASARETRYNYALGKQNSVFTQTNFNIFLDPRWGRGQEVPGEDPYLNTEYAKTWVAGVQTPEGPRGVPLAGTSCKHFTAYSLEGAGGWPYPTLPNRHNFDAIITAQDLADTHFPMYMACAEAGAMGMMTAYNAVNGVPMAANGHLTKGVARGKWGFNGTVVTDCGAVEDLWLRHKYSANASASAWDALKGGTDIECGSTVKDNAVEAMAPLLRSAVEASFAVRFRLGEFNPPQSGQDEPEMYDQTAHARLAYEAAVQGTVLLKNTEGFLPLAHGARIALMGPHRHATWEALGNYAAYKNNKNWSDSPNVVTPTQGLQQCGAISTVPVNPGAAPFVCSPTDEQVPGFNNPAQQPDADVVVLMVGIYCQDEKLQDVDRRPEDSGTCQSGCLESEGCDRPGLFLPKGQRALISRAAAWSIPVVLAVLSGGPLDLSEFDAMDNIKSILWMGYPGQAAGTALARMLMGFDSPSGRLTHTFYKNEYLDAVGMGTMNVRPDSATAYPGRTYRFVDPKWVVYNFGHGLTYQTWSYEWLGSSAPSSRSSGTFEGCKLRFRVDLASSGRARGAASASVLLFLAPPATACAGAPQKLLTDFARVHGASSQVSFSLGRSDFELADEDGAFALQAGEWLAYVNGDPAALKARVTVSEGGCSVHEG